jgi:hypothetical protein
MATEDAFVRVAHEEAEKLFLPEKYQIKRGAVLLYRINVDQHLTIQVDIRKPTRGKSAFETDLCVFEKRSLVDVPEKHILIPRVVMEFKTGITTHDVLVYSAKAKKHKQIYPYLRYGMVASRHLTVPGLFYSHNESLDFCASVKGLATTDLAAFFGNLLTSELNFSKKMESIAFNKASVKSRTFQLVPMLDGAID